MLDALGKLPHRICGYGWAMGFGNSSMRMGMRAGPQECPDWQNDRSDNETFPTIQSSEEHLMERATKVGNVDVINYVIGYNNTDTGLATVCVAPNHLLTLVNVSFLFFFFTYITLLLICSNKHT